MHASTSIANGLIHAAQTRGKAVSPMKLQKLLYFAQGFWLAQSGEVLVDEPLEAWIHGPVFPAVYHAFEPFGSSPIDAPACHIDVQTGALLPVPVPTGPVMDFLNALMDTYGEQTALELSRLARMADGPWAKARQGSKQVFGEEVCMQAMRTFFAGWMMEASVASSSPPERVTALPNMVF
jgi:uncharacterized phage-associated protein